MRAREGEPSKGGRSVLRPLLLVALELLAVAVIAVVVLAARANSAPTVFGRLQLTQEGPQISVLATLQNRTSAVREISLDWGDGGSELVPASEQGSSWAARAEHTYESAGSYEVQLVASFEDGSTVVRSGTVVVAAGPSLAGSPPSPAPSRRPTTSAQPTETPTATPAATPPQATPASESDGEGADGEEPFPFYIVQSGDGLAAIAKRFDVSISQLLTLNRIADPAVIEIGDRIRLPEGTSLDAPPIEGASGAPSGPPAGSAGAPPEAPNRSSPASTTTSTRN